MYKYTQILRRDSSRTALSLSSISAIAMHLPAAPLQPEALARFWQMLQCNFADLERAFHFLRCTSLQFASNGAFLAPAQVEIRKKSTRYSINHVE